MFLILRNKIMSEAISGVVDEEQKNNIDPELCNGCLIAPNCVDGDMHDKMSRLSALMDKYDGDLDKALAELEGNTPLSEELEEVPSGAEQSTSNNTEEQKDTTDMTPEIQSQIELEDQIPNNESPLPTEAAPEDTPGDHEPDQELPTKSEIRDFVFDELKPEQEEAIAARQQKSQQELDHDYDRREDLPLLSMKVIDVAGNPDLLFPDGTTLLGSLDEGMAKSGNGIGREEMAGYIAQLIENHEVFIPVYKDGQEVGLGYFRIEDGMAVAEFLDVKVEDEPELYQEGMETLDLEPSDPSNPDTQEATDEAEAGKESSLVIKTPFRLFELANAQSFQENGIGIAEVAVKPKETADHQDQQKIVRNTISQVITNLFRPQASSFNSERTLNAVTIEAGNPIMFPNEVIVTEVTPISTEQAPEQEQQKVEQKDQAEEKQEKQQQQKEAQQDILNPASGIESSSSHIYRGEKAEDTADEAKSHYSSTSTPRQTERLNASPVQHSEAGITIGGPESSPDNTPALEVDSVTGESFINIASEKPAFESTYETPETIQRAETTEQPIELFEEEPIELEEHIIESAPNTQEAKVIEAKAEVEKLLESLEKKTYTKPEAKVTRVSEPKPVRAREGIFAGPSFRAQNEGIQNRTSLETTKAEVSAQIEAAQNALRILNELRNTERPEARRTPTSTGASSLDQTSDDINNAAVPTRPTAVTARAA